jgi:hypothetical protein
VEQNTARCRGWQLSAIPNFVSVKDSSAQFGQLFAQHRLAGRGDEHTLGIGGSEGAPAW